MGTFDVSDTPAGETDRDPTNVESFPDVDATDAERDLRIPHTGQGVPLRVEPDDRPTIEAPAIIVDKPVEDERATIESPALIATLAEVTAHDDTVAAQRGVRPLTSPYVRTSSSRPSTRKILIASMSVAVVSLGIAVGSVMWARDAVANAGHEPPVVKAVEPPPAPIVEPPPVVEPPPPAVTTCSVDVTTSVGGATVLIDGKKSEANATVECGKPVTVEVRRARYETFKRTVTPTGHEEVRAMLEREKTSLTVWSEPNGAYVTYNGQAIGRTPLTVKIPRYEQGTLDFSMPGMQSDWRRIVPKTAEKTVMIQLRKQ